MECYNGLDKKCSYLDVEVHWWSIGISMGQLLTINIDVNKISKTNLIFILTKWNFLFFKILTLCSCLFGMKTCLGFFRPKAPQKVKILKIKFSYFRKSTSTCSGQCWPRKVPPLSTAALLLHFSSRPLNTH